MKRPWRIMPSACFMRGSPAVSPAQAQTDAISKMVHRGYTNSSFRRDTSGTVPLLDGIFGIGQAVQAAKRELHQAMLEFVDQRRKRIDRLGRPLPSPEDFTV
jgi:hypothetical protein